jgi:predicted DNA-binding protein (MmcQ/YjbR family)
MAKSNAARQTQAALRARALAYPGAKEEFPWGERVIKVDKKVFVFLGHDESDEVGLSVKLPASKEMALLLPFVEPTGYGLGKAGWVTARFGPGEKPPLEMLYEWLDESYRAVAPKKRVAALEETPPGAVKPAATSRRRTPLRGGARRRRRWSLRTRSSRRKPCRRGRGRSP